MTEADVAPGEDRSVALALVNSDSLRLVARPDAIHDAGTLADWLEDHGLDAGRQELVEHDVAQTRLLRAHIRTLFQALEFSATVPPESVETLNAFSEGALGAPTLVVEGTRLETRWTSAQDGITAALSTIARDAIAVSQSPDAHRLHTCDAAGCIRMFIPARASRRWCSTGCGDRVRAVRHYARSRPA